MFARIGQAIPNISLSALPIGAYGSPKERWFHRFNHMDPSEAVQTHIDLRSKWSLGVHWGTFALTGEPIMEPPLLLRNALQVMFVVTQSFRSIQITQLSQERNLDLDKFIVLKHGETKSFPLD
jgi:N-acyl-phosphatidylethanolamine-hydrolysing phospholipase D